MEPVRVAVIMAGGVGERFWPLSRNRRPKQLLNLTSPSTSLLAEALAHIAPILKPEHVFVATSRDLAPIIAEAAPQIPRQNVIGEPCRRNTSGCLVLAAATILARLGLAPEQVTLAVLTADHLIGEPVRFRRTLETALAAAEREDALVTIGIRPTRPETGYGYIEVKDAPTPGQPDTAQLPVLPVVRFREKPDLAAAKRFVAEGRFFWNSGMFFWRLSTFGSELEVASPAMAAGLRTLTAALVAGNQAEADRVFSALPSKSIDYALMERARRVLVVPGDFPWDDVGAWDALDRTLPHDPQGNVAVGEPILVDSANCIVYNAPGAAKMAVACVGLQGLVVAVTADGVVVMPKRRAQEVRAVVAELRRRGGTQL